MCNNNNIPPTAATSPTATVTSATTTHKQQNQQHENHHELQGNMNNCSNIRCKVYTGNVLYYEYKIEEINTRMVEYDMNERS